MPTRTACCSSRPVPKRESHAPFGPTVACLTIGSLMSVLPRGENVEEAFLETARKIYQNILDGNLDLNAAETGVQPKQPTSARSPNNLEQKPSENSCNC